jgi:hypothetical protein
MKKQLLILATALLSISTFSQIPNYVPANGLVGWWPFNGNANDESGNGNHGTVNGATLTQDRYGNLNGAYSFNGSNVLIPLTQQIVSMSERTVSLWFYSAQAQSGGRLFEATNYSWGIGCYNNTTFDCWYQKSNQAYNIVGESFQSHNTWYNLVYVCDSTSQTKKIYFNGTLIYTGLPVSNPGNPITWLNHFLKIGQGNANESFIGSIDEIGIWNRALTQCEILDLYYAQLNVNQGISAGADQSICAGDNVTLSGAGGSNYQWNNNVVDGQAFTPNQSANYVLNGTDSLGCQGTDTVVVTVLENATSTLTQTALDSYTLNGQTYTQSGTYIQTLTAANGCDSTITLNLTLNFTGMDELGTGAKKLVKITDLNGKIIPRRKNTLMLFIYEDGTVERVVEIEE